MRLTKVQVDSTNLLYAIKDGLFGFMMLLSEMNIFVDSTPFCLT